MNFVPVTSRRIELLESRLELIGERGSDEQFFVLCARIEVSVEEGKETLHLSIEQL